jgi:hypothetical protein
LLNDPLSHLDRSVSVKKGGGIVHPFFCSRIPMKSSRILHTTLFLAGVIGAHVAGAAALPAPFAEQLNASYPAIETLYQDLHRNPELGFNEHQTAAKLAERAKALGFDVTTGVGGTGVVAILKNGPGPTVMLRTEMDALPVQEKTGLPFASNVTGKNAAGDTVPVMHACGHDLHMSAWYGTAKLMAENRKAWSGTLMLVGQPSEEPVNGASAMLKDGLFTRFPKPDYALSFHDDATMPAGQVDHVPRGPVPRVVRRRQHHRLWPGRPRRRAARGARPDRDGVAHRAGAADPVFAREQPDRPGRDHRGQHPRRHPGQHHPGPGQAAAVGAHLQAGSAQARAGQHRARSEGRSHRRRRTEGAAGRSQAGHRFGLQRSGADWPAW